ncbi:MAG: hypothetical protein ACI88G_000255 [Woeseiaceae bacterium]|jgi:hypothetical protein
MKLSLTLGLLFLVSTNTYASDSPYLFVWAADADKENTDFVAVLDANPDSDSYGEVLSTLEVGVAAGAHHSEHRMPEGGRLFVNGFKSGHSFVADLRNPLAPSVDAHFTTIEGYSHPHSFERLPNGNVLATFQNGPDGARITGGIAELGPLGKPVRRASAADPDFPEIRPYSLIVLPEKDLVITTTTDMWGEEDADSVQFWQLSELSLKRTLRLPAGPRGDEQFWPAEPRLMADGSTLLINTFKCGLYQIHDFASDNPRFEHVYTFKLKDEAGEQQFCALPALSGQYWIQTVPARNGLVSIDLSDPANPREVSYVNFGPGSLPHWIAIEPNEGRIVVTGYGEMQNSVTMVKVDTSNGSLSLDRDFGNNGVVDFARTNWPHGENGAAIPHGSVFSFP